MMYVALKDLLKSIAHVSYFVDGKSQMIFKKWKYSGLYIWILFAVFVAVSYTYSVMMQLELGLISDFRTHVSVAKGMMDGVKAPPHFLYHIILIFIHNIAGLSIYSAQLVLVFAIVYVTCIIAFRGIITELKINRYIVTMMVMFLLISHPVAILEAYDGHLYLGYIASNVYHNPTILLLKPIALLHFIIVTKLLSEHAQYKESLQTYVVLVILTALSIIAKPNYIIVLLPAVIGLVILHKFLLKSNISNSEKALLYVISVPTAFILAWQYLWYFGSQSNKSIGVDPFAVFTYSSELWTLLPKLFLSMAFPISVIVVIGMPLFRRKEFQLASLMLFISLAYSYILVDVGKNGRYADGNFWWSAQISHFILLYVCIKSYLKYLYDIKKHRVLYDLIPGIVGSCQLIFGLLWYYLNSSKGSGMSW